MRRALPAAAACLALLAGGCGGSGSAPKSPDGAPTSRVSGATAAAEELRDLLDRRANALEAGDAEAYAATASGPQAVQDLRSATRAGGLGVSDVSLQAFDAEVTGDSARIDLGLRYGIEGIESTFEWRHQAEARRTAEGWRVEGVAGTRELPPWELGDFERHRSPHFVILAPSGLPEAPLEEALETGYQRTAEVLVKPELAPRYLVVVAADSRQARSLTEQISGVGGLAAIADAEVREEGPAQRVSEVVSQRMLVVWPRFAETDLDGRVRVVTHELAHTVLARVTSGRTPSWLLEGLALFVSEDRRVGEAAELVAAGGSTRVRRALTLSGLSEPDAIARLDGSGQRAAYAYSSAASFYIATRFGERRLLRLYEAFNDESIEGEPGSAVTDAAVRRVLGVSLARLERDLRRWILTRAVVSPLSP